MKRIFLFVIYLYQKLFSPDHSWARAFFPYGYCRYYPTCSDYMKDAILRYGTFVGTAKGLARLMRCQPWHKGGIDKA